MSTTKCGVIVGFEGVPIAVQLGLRETLIYHDFVQDALAFLSGGLTRHGANEYVSVVAARQ